MMVVCLFDKLVRHRYEFQILRLILIVLDWRIHMYGNIVNRCRKCRRLFEYYRFVICKKVFIYLRFLEKPGMPLQPIAILINDTIPAMIRVQWSEGFDGNSPIIKCLFCVNIKKRWNYQ
jgi:hypothetical protein